MTSAKPSLTVCQLPLQRHPLLPRPSLLFSCADSRTLDARRFSFPDHAILTTAVSGTPRKMFARTVVAKAPRFPLLPQQNVPTFLLPDVAAPIPRPPVPASSVVLGLEACAWASTNPRHLRANHSRLLPAALAPIAASLARSASSVDLAVKSRTEGCGSELIKQQTWHEIKFALQNIIV